MMPMGTKLNKVPSTEKELNELLQEIYSTAKDCYESKKDAEKLKYKSKIYLKFSKSLLYI